LSHSAEFNELLGRLGVHPSNYPIIMLLSVLGAIAVFIVSCLKAVEIGQKVWMAWLDIGEKKRKRSKEAESLSKSSKQIIKVEQGPRKFFKKYLLVFLLLVGIAVFLAPALPAIGMYSAAVTRVLCILVFLFAYLCLHQASWKRRGSSEI
jgi:hypothetical protein